MSVRVDDQGAATMESRLAGVTDPMSGATQETPDGQDALAVLALAYRREREAEQDTEAAESGSESTGGESLGAALDVPPESVQVAASDEGAATDSPPADAQGAAPAAPGDGSAPTSRPQENAGWMPEGLWIKAAGVALIGGIAIATDDDDDDDNTVDPSNAVPAITSNGGGNTAAINVDENSTAVTTVVATDDDDTDTLTYSISGGTDAQRFGIDATTGVLSFVEAPDYEDPKDTGSNNLYNVIVTASDGVASDVQSINVKVVNRDEDGNEAPEITSNGGGASATRNLAENTTAVTTVLAVDVDEDSELTYSISGGADAGFFTINAESGVLRFISAPDFENRRDAGSNNTYIVQVTASDGELSDTQTLTVTVTNVAENAAPQITSNGGGATASVESAEAQTAVTTVLASDPEEGDALTYSIGGGADAERFEIDATTGVLSFAEAPDFEAPTDADADNFYEVIVTASDGDLSDSQALSVEVTDVDEDNQAPTIDSGDGADTVAVQISEGLAEVTTVLASDPDDDTLDFSIIGGDDAGLFEIDAVSGVLSFLAAPDFDTPSDADADNVYQVMVGVSDGSASDSQAIAVTVTEMAAAMAAGSFDAGAALFTDPDPVG